jgi:hypothetical protein
MCRTVTFYSGRTPLPTVRPMSLASDTGIPGLARICGPRRAACPARKYVARAGHPGRETLAGEGGSVCQPVGFGTATGMMYTADNDSGSRPRKRSGHRDFGCILYTLPAFNFHRIG